MPRCGAPHPEDPDRTCIDSEMVQHADHSDRQGTWPNVEVQERMRALAEHRPRNRTEGTRSLNARAGEVSRDRMANLDAERRQQRGLRDPTRPMPPLAHTDAVDTEQQAAEMVVPRAGSLRMLALERITERYPDGLTDTELAEVSGEYRYTMAPRRYELSRTGWVEDSGMRRRNERTRPEVVWRLTERAVRLIEET